MRGVYADRRQALLNAIQRWPMLQAGARPAPSGINLTVYLPALWPDVEVVARLAARRVAPGALSAHHANGHGANGLVLGFGADDAQSIGAAVDAVGEVLEQMASGKILAASSPVLR